MPAAMIHWLAISVIAAMTAVSMKSAGLSFDCFSAAKLAIVCTIMQSMAYFYQIKRPDDNISTTLSLIAKLIAFSALATLLSYAVAATDRPTWDQTFLAWDQTLGLDWFAYLNFIQSHPILKAICRAAYQSVIIQTFVAVGVLGLSGNLKRAEEFVLSYAIAGLIAIAASGLMPAIAMFIHIGSDDAFARLVDAPFVATIKSLRDGSLTIITLEQMDGVITFPSFHTALGVIFGYSFWVLPKWRWIGVAVNVLLIAGTPINGGHYFVDILAGVVVGIVAIWIARLAAATRLPPRHLAEISAPLGFQAPSIGSA
ncbi:phosphatase PAP2 family protein [Methylobacterium sp. C33D]